MTRPPSPRANTVGGRAPTTGSSSHHLNGNGGDHDGDHGDDRGDGYDPDDDRGFYVIAYAACALSGFVVGFVVAWVIFS
jgi:hypothetical protein